MEAGAKQGPIPNISHTYPAIMKLGTVITYLKRIQKIYKSRLLNSADIFYWKSPYFAISRNTDKDCVLIHNS